MERQENNGGLVEVICGYQNSTGEEMAVELDTSLDLAHTQTREIFEEIKAGRKMTKEWFGIKLKGGQDISRFIAEISELVCEFEEVEDQVTTAVIITELIQLRFISKMEVLVLLKRIVTVVLPELSIKFTKAVSSFAMYLTHLFVDEDDLDWLVSLSEPMGANSPVNNRLVSNTIKNLQSLRSEKFVQELMRRTTGATRLQAKPVISKIQYTETKQEANGSPKFFVSTKRQRSPTTEQTNLPSNASIIANPPMPPDWEEYHAYALAQMTHFMRFPVNSISEEYNVLSQMVGPMFTVINIQKIVNPELWRKFCEARRDLLIRKSGDKELLAALGLPEHEIQRLLRMRVNFPLRATEYTENIALLFHGTRGNIDSILSEGLDERMASPKLLGKGIYFADDANKAANYDATGSTLLIFAVILGDCCEIPCDISTLSNESIVREPQKSVEQKRNYLDTTFDSVAMRLELRVGMSVSSNEYVIYNRNQCCPLYTVTYSRRSNLLADKVQKETEKSSIFDSHQKDLPPFVWRPPNVNLGSSISSSMHAAQVYFWPFEASNVFHQMRSNAHKEDPDPILQHGTNTSAKHLSTLQELGFKDEALNARLLEIYDNNLESTVNYLTQAPQSSSSTIATHLQASSSRASTNFAGGTSASTNRIQRRLSTSFRHISSPQNTANTPAEPTEECLICFTNYPCAEGENWKLLQCQHKICAQCHSRLETSSTTMSGVRHTFIKCPFCNDCDGVEIGTCPDGVMTTEEIPSPIAGYELYTAHRITYLVPGRIGVCRICYVPNTPEGNKVVELLKVAWDRRLIFRIGTSATTGSENVLVWNIHHKTALQGGVSEYGYPDPTYLIRVQQELAQYNIQ